MTTPKKLVLLFSLLLILGTEPLLAQLKVDAQLRNRLEMRHGFQKLAATDAEAAYFVSQRTRISFTYETDALLLKLSPQDVRVWGDEQGSTSTGVFGDEASLDLFEAYAALKTGSKTSLTIGRQQLVYDNQRMFAARNWSQYGLAYDAILFKWTPAAWNVHTVLSWNSTGENSTDNLYSSARIKSLALLWANYQPDKNKSVSFSYIASGQTKSDTENKQYFRQTTGVYGKLKQGDWNLSGNLFYQFGKSQAGADVSAFLFDVESSYKLGKLTYGIGANYLSGNKKTDGTDHLFDILYGARHSFFGGMDYFRTFSSNTKGGGLTDAYTFLEWKISEKTTLKNTCWYFWLAQTNENTPDKKALGFENDLLLSYRFSSWGNLESGYFFYLPTESLKTVQSVADDGFSHYFYLQLSITPQLFNENKSNQKI